MENCLQQGRLGLVRDKFSFIDATPDGWPARFGFYVPSANGLSDWPHYPHAALPTAGRAGGGRGLDQDSCERSGIGEAIEIASVCEWGSEDLLTACAAELGSACLSAEEINGHSHCQIADREAWNRKFFKYDWRPPSLSPETQIEWIQFHDADEGHLFVPADAVYVGRRRPGDEDATSIARTSGCAAGSSLWQAKQNACLELIERDAIGRWWYGARRRLVIENDILQKDAKLHEFVVKRLRRTCLYDITADLGIPVVAAVSSDPDGRRIAMGFSARFHLRQAATSATLEMLQIEISLTQRQAAGDPLLTLWIDQVNCDTGPLGRDQPSADTALPARPRFGDAFEALQKGRIRYYWKEFSRPEFNVPVVRVIAPQLCHDLPRWGCERLTGADEYDLATIPNRVSNGEPPNPIPLLI